MGVHSISHLSRECSILGFSLYLISSVVQQYKNPAKWSMPKATDGKTESSSLSSLCMTLTTMAALDEAKYKENSEIMAKLWNEIADLADFDKDGEVTTEEFIKAIRTTALGKGYDGLPACLKTFIGAMFKTIDIDGDGNIGIEEYRQDCVKRMAYSN